MFEFLWAETFKEKIKVASIGKIIFMIMVCNDSYKRSCEDMSNYRL